MLDPISLYTVFSAFIPTASYVIKRITDYKTGGAKASNATEEAQLGQVDVDKLKAIAELDNADGASQWVINIRALQRPIVVYTVLFNWSMVTLGLIHVDLQLYVITANLASSVMFYLFGDRSLMYSIQEYNKKLMSR